MKTPQLKYSIPPPERSLGLQPTLGEMNLLRNEMRLLQEECVSRIEIMDRNTKIIKQSVIEEAKKALIAIPAVITSSAKNTAAVNTLNLFRAKSTSSTSNITSAEAIQHSPLHTIVPPIRRISDVQMSERALPYETIAQKVASPKGIPLVIRKHTAKQPGKAKKRSHAAIDNDHDALSGDYSRVKPQTQIPISQFTVYMEQFFRQVLDDDMRYLAYRVN